MNLACEDRGQGKPVLFIAGQGGVGRTWDVHQVPAFRSAGYRVITFDNRGVGDTADAVGFTTATMVSDTAALIERLGAAPVRVVAVSMGAYIAQELMLARPELVLQAALLATRGRQDRARSFFQEAERELLDTGVDLPATYAAKLLLLENFSPKTLNDDRAVKIWIDTFTMWPTLPTPGLRAQYGITPATNPTSRIPIDHHPGVGHRIRRRPRIAATSRRGGSGRVTPRPLPRDRRCRPPGLFGTSARCELSNSGLLRRSVWRMMRPPRLCRNRNVVFGWFPSAMVYAPNRR